MPEMPNIPILTALRPVAGGASASFASSATVSSATPSNTQRAAGIAGSQESGSAGMSDAVADPAGKEGGSASFADILKQQLARSPAATTPRSDAQPPSNPFLQGDLSAGSVADVATLTGMRLDQLFVDGGRDAAAAGIAAASRIDDILSGQGDDANASTDVAALVDSTDPITTLIQQLNRPQDIFAGLEAVSGDQGFLKADEASLQDTAVGDLAAALAFSPVPLPAVTQVSPATVSADDLLDGETVDDQPLLTASAASWLPASAGGDGEASTGASPGTPPSALTPLDQSADFAAAQALATEQGVSSSTGNEPQGGALSFENMLAAAHMAGGQARVAEAHASHAPAHGTISPEVKTPVGAQGWDSEVGDKLVWMVNRQEQRAELVLNPPQLGRVEVSLSMNGDQTNASFVSANPAVRDALEAALPRLREILADAGVSLGQTQVGAESSNNAANQSADRRGNGHNPAHHAADLDTVESGALRQDAGRTWIRQGRGLVDTFA